MFRVLCLLLLSIFLGENGNAASRGKSEKKVKQGATRTNDKTKTPRFQINASRIIPRERAASDAPKAQEVKRGMKFLLVHRHTLKHAEWRYGVSREAVTAVLKQESNLGIHLGEEGVYRTLRTRALDSQEARARAEAARQLKCFLQLSSQERWNPHAIYGASWGELGIPQFLPCSWLAYAVDGNDDGVVNLFDPQDAIMSTARFLEAHGWRRGLKTRALFHYNRDEEYGRSVLAYARALRSASVAN